METKTPAFLADSAIEPVQGEAGRYRSVLTEAWNAPVIPFGGLMSAIAARACQAELADRAQRLRSVNTVFAAQVEPGPVDIEVEVLRAGRGLSQMLARVHNSGRDGSGHITTAIFGAPRRGFDYTDLEPPEALGPGHYSPMAERPAAYSAWQSRAFENFDLRPVKGHNPWDEGWIPDKAEYVRWVRFVETPRISDGTIDPLALIALADTMPIAVGQKVGPGYPLFFGFSCDLTVHLLDATRSEWFLERIHCRRALDGYASGEIEIWDEERRLVAYATQLMFLSFPK